MLRIRIFHRFSIGLYQSVSKDDKDLFLNKNGTHFSVFARLLVVRNKNENIYE